MESTRVRYSYDDGVSRIDIDDGKVNALSPAMQADLGGALDRALTDDGVVVISGRAGVFSAGFDLTILAAGSGEAAQMVIGGFELARRLLAHPRPVLMACTGHAIAMGSFLLLSGDHRIATTSPARVQANEVAIGMTLPRTAVELLRDRLTPAAFQRAGLLAEAFDPEGAVAAGFLDELVEPDRFDARVSEVATAFVQLDRRAHAASKERVRAGLLARLDAAIEQDRAELAAIMSPPTDG